MARRLARRHAWTAGVYVLLVRADPLLANDSGEWGTFDVQSLAIDALPFAFAAMAQAVVIISGGIDLSINELMGLVNVLSAKYMFDDERAGGQLPRGDRDLRRPDPGRSARRRAGRA